MKKYVVVCEKEVIREVCDELERVGFFPTTSANDISTAGIPFITINAYKDGEYDVITHDVCKRIGGHDEVLLPSYVLEHAAELDGAKRLLIPPKGYRLVTDEELEKYRYRKIPDHMYCCDYFGAHWKHADGYVAMGGLENLAFAVPEDYVFGNTEKTLMIGGKEVSESTVAKALEEYFKS